MTNLIPFNDIQRATHSAIIAGMKSRSGETPYANAFFKHFYGSSRPSKKQLIGLFGNTYTIPQITLMVNGFLESNGTKPTMLPSEFTFKAFPSLEARSKFREENHFDMVQERSSKVSHKQSVAQILVKDKAREEIMRLSSSELGTWLDEYESQIDAFDIQSLFREWYLSKDGCAIEFQYNLSHLEPREMLYQLCFI